MVGCLKRRNALDERAWHDGRGWVRTTDVEQDLAVVRVETDHGDPGRVIV